MSDPSDRYAETFPCGCEWHAGNLSECEQHRGAGRTAWDYRVIRHPGGVLAVHEVYYDEYGFVVGWKQTPSEVLWGTALDKPVLEVVGQQLHPVRE